MFLCTNRTKTEIKYTTMLAVVIYVWKVYGGFWFTSSHISAFSKVSTGNLNNFYTSKKNVRKTRGSQLMVSCRWKIWNDLSFCQQEAPVLVRYCHPSFYSAFTKQTAPITLLMFIWVNECPWPPCGPTASTPPAHQESGPYWSTDCQSCRKKQGMRSGKPIKQLPRFVLEV